MEVVKTKREDIVEIDKIFDTYEIKDADFNGNMKQTTKKVSENLITPAIFSITNRVFPFA